MIPLLQRIRRKFYPRQQFGIVIVDPSHARPQTREKQEARILINSVVSKGGDEDDTGRGRWWNPTWLQPLTIGSFAVLATALAIGTFALWYSNTRRQGIQLISNDHYLWTYGPTAILVCVVAAWRQLDYHCKTLFPWAVLQQERASAGSSILLDHVTPLQVVSFGRAIKSGHSPIIASISGFVLLKLVTLASTGLLEPRDLSITKINIGVLRTSRLDGSLFNRTEYIARPDSSLVYNAYGTAAFGLDSPDGLSKQGFVYETFYWPDVQDQSNLSVTAKVKALIPQFTCQPADVSVNPDSSGTNASDSTMTIVSPSCELAAGVDPTFIIDQSVLETTVCPTIQRRGIMQAVNCSGDTSEAANAQLLVLAEILYQQDFQGDITKDDVGKAANVTSGSVNIGRVESVICRPTYAVVAANTTYDLSRSPPQVKLSFAGSGNDGGIHNLQKLSDGGNLDGFSDDDLSLTFLAALLDSADLFGEATENEFAEDFPNTMFKMMAGSAPDGYASLFGENGTGRSKLALAAQDVFRSITGQVVTKNLRRPVDDSLPGEVSYIETRLVVNELAVWLMFGGLILVAIMTAVLWVSHPHNVVPYPLESLLGSRKILAESGDFEGLVKTHLDHATKALDESLQHCDFVTTSFMAYKHSAITFSIDIFKLSPAAQFNQSRKHDHSLQKSLDDQWWKPLMLSRSLTIFTLLLPLLTFAGLELVHRLSRKVVNGIPLSIGDGEVVNAVLLSRLIPALTMLLIATMFNAVDFNIALLAPFTAMKREAFPMSNNTGRSLISELPVVALWKALKMRWWPAGSSALAALIGSLLTIIVSGLYTIDPTPRIGALTLSKAQVLNTSLTQAKIEDGSAASLLSLLESANLSLPASTYNDLMFPMLGASYEGTENRLGPNATIFADIPALQASLRCSALSPQAVSVTTSYNPRIFTGSVSVSARTALPSKCPHGGSGGDLPFIDFSQSFSLPQNGSYIGKLLDLHVGPYDDILGSSAGETDPTQPDNPPGCPSLAFIYGYADVNNADITAVTTLICTQHIRQVDTETFMTPQQKVVNSTIVSPADTPNLPASQTDKALTAFPFRIQLPLDASLSLFNQTIFPSAANAQTPVDSFFQGVLFGKTPLYPESYTALARTSDKDRKTVLKAIQAFYGRYMAQAMSVSMRQPLSKSTRPETARQEAQQEVWNVTVYDNSTAYVLTQHKTSKVILQVMLLTMTALMAFAIIHSERSGGLQVVKYNPCTIWGRMALLVGSDLVLKENDVGKEGRMVRLGWKVDTEGRKRRWVLSCVDAAEDESRLVSQRLDGRRAHEIEQDGDVGRVI